MLNPDGTIPLTLAHILRYSNIPVLCEQLPVAGAPTGAWAFRCAVCSGRFVKPDGAKHVWVSVL